MVRNVLKGWMDTNEVDKFSTKGLPKVPEVNKELNFTADRSEILEVWYKLQEED